MNQERTQEQVKKQILLSKPKYLCHVSRALNGNLKLIEPKENTTMYEEEKGRFVFASSNPNADMISIFKVKGSIFNFGARINGAEVCIIFVENIDQVRRAIEENPAYIYKVSSDTFSPVVSKKGEFFYEWVSESAVEIVENCGKITLKDILKQGAQVFFVEIALNEEEKKDKNLRHKRVKQILQVLRNIKSEAEAIFILSEMVKNKIITYENRIQGINDNLFDKVNQNKQTQGLN